MIQVVTHNGGFHADDVFAVATLQLHVGIEQVQVIRTRDEAIIAKGDWVVDVGGVHDPQQQRFDHHQHGAPVRENGIPYAAFGLVWEHVGASVAGDASIANEVAEKLVLPIDATDNGVSLYTLSEHAVKPVTLSDMVALLCPSRGSGQDMDTAFLDVVAIARNIIESAIRKAQVRAEMRAYVDVIFTQTQDRQVLVFDTPVSRRLMIEYPEVYFFVCPDDPATSTNWIATAVAKGKDTFETRMPFPEAWAGLSNEALVEVSGIPDALFCHRNRFMFVAGSKEGALAAVAKTRAQQ